MKEKLLISKSSQRHVSALMLHLAKEGILGTKDQQVFLQSVFEQMPKKMVNKMSEVYLSRGLEKLKQKFNR